MRYFYAEGKCYTFDLNTAKLEGKTIKSLEVIVNLITNTTTQKWVIIKAKADKNKYEKGITIDDEILQNINLTNKEFRGDWIYEITP